MIPVTLDEIGRLSGGRVMGDYLNTLITGISTDSRQAKAGDLFVALVGENSDGHDYVEKAIDKGASAAMVHANWYNTFLPTHGQFIVVDYSDRPGCDSPLLALGQLGENYRKRFDIPVVGITGSMGKTSTREILGTILRSRMNPLVSKANFNTEIGVPITLMDLTDANDVAVLEMAMRGLGQIEYLCKIAQPTAAIITNVGLSHIELLKTQDRIAEAKAELLENLPGQGWSVLNADDDYFEYLAKKAPGPVITFGRSARAQYRASNVILDVNGCAQFDLEVLNNSIPVHLKVPGEFHVYNATAAAAAAARFGFDSAEIASSLETYEGFEKRTVVFESSRGCKVFDDTYNASPAAMAGALASLMAMETDGRKIAVLGDMRELGDHAETAHRMIGSKLADLRPDLLVTVGQSSLWIAETAVGAGYKGQVEHFSESRDAAEFIVSVVLPNDIVLVKGSRALQMEKIVEQLV